MNAMLIKRNRSQRCCWKDCKYCWICSNFNTEYHFLFRYLLHPFCLSKVIMIDLWNVPYSLVPYFSSLSNFYISWKCDVKSFSVVSSFFLLFLFLYFAWFSQNSLWMGQIMSKSSEEFRNSWKAEKSGKIYNKLVWIGYQKLTLIFILSLHHQMSSIFHNLKKKRKYPRE